MKKNTQIHTDPFAKREAKRYDNPIVSREYILEFLNQYNQPVTHTALCDLLHIEEQSQQIALGRRLGAMVRDGQLIKNRRNQYALIKKTDLVSGSIVGRADGLGYFIPDKKTKRKILVLPKQMSRVMHGDRVLVRLQSAKKGRRYEATIVEVLDHAHTHMVGLFKHTEGVSYVMPSDKRINQAILIPKAHVLGAQPNQWVRVVLTGYPDQYPQPIGKIEEILGESPEPGIETEVVMRAHQLPYRWSDAVEQAAHALEIHLSSHAKPLSAEKEPERRDLCHLPFVTIDGPSAKDFDDAVYAEACPPEKGGGMALMGRYCRCELLCAPR